MTKILEKVIGECQHTFMGGRQILNTILIVNEVVDNLVGKKMK